MRFAVGGCLLFGILNVNIFSICTNHTLKISQNFSIKKQVNWISFLFNFGFCFLDSACVFDSFSCWTWHFNDWLDNKHSISVYSFRKSRKSRWIYRKICVRSSVSRENNTLHDGFGYHFNNWKYLFVACDFLIISRIYNFHSQSTSSKFYTW